VIVRRLFLRNYRVYEGDLELEIPDGLVGVYGPNGAGKSYLIESIPFALFGYTRDSIEQVRSASVNDECVVELDFEHQGHLYTARRTISGGKTQKREAFLSSAGLQLATGAREVEAAIHSILGMRAKGFLASVFAEQKQLALLSGQTPAERRKLVLDLLGISPIESAVKRASSEARAAEATLFQLKTVSGDVESLKVAADDAAAAVAGLTADATAAEASAAMAAERAETARVGHEALRRELEVGQQLARRHEEAAQRVAELEAELALVVDAEKELAGIGDPGVLLPERREAVALVSAVARAREQLAQCPRPAEATPPDESAAAAARVAEAEAGGELAGARAEAALLADAVRAAEAAVAKADALDAGAECPTCGHELGDTFVQVQTHRRADLDAAIERAAQAVEAGRVLAQRAAELAAAARAHEAALASARQSWDLASKQRARHETTEESLVKAIAAANAVQDGLADVDFAALSAEVDQLARAERRASELRGLLQQAPTLRGRLEAARPQLEAITAELEERRHAAKAAGLSRSAVEEAEAERRASAADANSASEFARAAHASLAKAEAQAASSLALATRAAEQQARIEPQAMEARLLGRLKELLSAFKDNEAASVGPRLAGHARATFDAMTDHVYTGFDLTDEFEVRLTDGPRAYDLKRFSGSEVDLANLALRIAISECVTLQSGGAVELLVLDEVFGPLDADRRRLVLNALDGLRTRFRQVLVVTHADDVKAHLGSAIEVRPTGERRATAAVV